MSQQFAPQAPSHPVQQANRTSLPMVSRAEVADHSHSRSHSQSRAAPSVVSRTSRSRNHHSRGRSQYGGSSHVPQNEFPFFSQTGDVEIVIVCGGQEKRYLLHSFTLAQFSGFFQANTTEGWSRGQPQQGGRNVSSASRPDQALSAIGEESSQVSSTAGPSLPAPPHPAAPVSAPTQRRRWRFELDWEDLEEDDEPILVHKTPQGSLFTPAAAPPPPLSPPERPRHQHTSFFRSMANLTFSHHGPASQSSAQLATPAPDPCLTNPLLRDYDNLFRIFYNYAPVLNSSNIASAYSECKALLSLADMYDALPVVGPRIDHHLLRFSSRLFKQIAKYPPSYLKLGYLARSRIIFSEALTHVVGQWPAALPYIKPPDHSGAGYEVPQSVIDLIEDKVDELEELKQKVETKLYRLTLTTSRGERVNPANDYLGWLAVSLWRQWLAENTAPEIRGILKNSPNSRPGSGHANANMPPSVHGRPLPPGTVAQNPMPPPPPYQAHAPAPPAINTGRIFRLIGSSDPDKFLADDELKRFLKLTPPGSSHSLYSRENLRRFERKIDEIKNVARDIVKPLTRNCLELDLRSLSDGGGGGLGYLTCMRCEEDELPWEL
ncbi:uncharacterized protein Z520_04462 [Fonsecaea multimorphosa CBS 102226]|uniref:BTB domain-containing protein n=1 Tax=Fonsecaea multimorphosa CBS 102226 TaxID=1442371 RepID=A0A0D2IS56_9EURO|nr:uncharacterized protein Z520_04462 [Fonsecaea multimorphosa CBS 102226]KIX99826.1 hypothetical protein Z520_04462 [Fonsecaea multimorphosa CBS 102226]OAL26306.1 hypothetical protein AYO22_04224 [Fonsecaea multimorphosa]